MRLSLAATLVASVSAHVYKICSGTTDGFGLTAVGLSPDPVPSFAELTVTFTGTPTNTFDAGSTATLTVKLLGIKLTTLHFDACKDLGMTCPIAAGKEVTGTIKYKVPSSVPAGLSANVELVLKDSAGAKITCVDVDAKLGPGKSMAMTAMARPDDAEMPPPHHGGAPLSHHGVPLPPVLALLHDACPAELEACRPSPPTGGPWEQTEECVAAMATACPSCFEGVLEGARSVHEASSWACMKPCVMANGAALKAAGCRKPPKEMRERFHEMREGRSHDEHHHRRRGLHEHEHDHHEHDDHHEHFPHLREVQECFQQLEAISAPCAAGMRAALPPPERHEERETLAPEEIEQFFRVAEAEEEHHHHCHHHHHHRVAMAAAVVLLAVGCACCVRRRHRRTRAARAEAEASWTALGDAESSGIALGEVILADGTPMVIVGEKLQPLTFVAQQ